MIFARFIAAIAIGYAAALAFFPALALERWKRVTALLIVYVPVALAPLVVPPNARFIRFLATVISVALLVKLYDLEVGARRGLRPDFRTFAAFLPNIFSYVLRKLDAEPRPGRTVDLARLTRSLAGLAAWTVILVALFCVDWRGLPFAAEHSAKVLALGLALFPGASVAGALWRLGGGRGREFMDAPLLARTPADFWRRYNRPTNQFFYEDIFKPANGFRAPIRATLLTFAVSALVHEYVFGIVLGRVQGYQTVFFLLQGCAAAATLRIRPNGWSAMLWGAATLGFNLATAVFFFASVNGMVPFYSRGVPPWLAGW
jgi:hypothetical protein